MHNKIKKITLKKTKIKKANGDMFYVGPSPGGKSNTLYAYSDNAKRTYEPAHSLVKKAKFFLKNKKTGKTITKIAKGKFSKYGWIEPHRKVSKNYTLIKTIMYYVLR